MKLFWFWADKELLNIHVTNRWVTRIYALESTMQISKSCLLITVGLANISLQAQTLTRDNGAPVGDDHNSITAGDNGSVLLQDVHFIQKLQRSARERIPERVVHARGTVTHGEFVASDNFSDLTVSALVIDRGKVVSARFSTVIQSKGSPKILRDPRGFATTFYTEQGNWGLYGKVLSPEKLSKFDYNGLDATKVWLNVPDQKVGTMTLNRVPDNLFLDTEQSAFSPSHLIPGIEPSEGCLLQDCLFAYSDTPLYRFGANLSQLPINQPLIPLNNHNHNGVNINAAQTHDDVNYEPS